MFTGFSVVEMDAVYEKDFAAAYERIIVFIGKCITGAFYFQQWEKMLLFKMQKRRR